MPRRGSCGLAARWLWRCTREPSTCRRLPLLPGLRLSCSSRRRTPSPAWSRQPLGRACAPISSSATAWTQKRRSGRSLSKRLRRRRWSTRASCSSSASGCATSTTSPGRVAARAGRAAGAGGGRRLLARQHPPQPRRPRDLGPGDWPRRPSWPSRWSTPSHSRGAASRRTTCGRYSSTRSRDASTPCGPRLAVSRRSRSYGDLGSLARSRRARSRRGPTRRRRPRGARPVRPRRLREPAIWRRRRRRDRSRARRGDLERARSCSVASRAPPRVRAFPGALPSPRAAVVCSTPPRASWSLGRRASSERSSTTSAARCRSSARARCSRTDKSLRRQEERREARAGARGGAALFEAIDVPPWVERLQAGLARSGATGRRADADGHRGSDRRARRDRPPRTS